MKFWYCIFFIYFCPIPLFRVDVITHWTQHVVQANLSRVDMNDICIFLVNNFHMGYAILMISGRILNICRFFKVIEVCHSRLNFITPQKIYVIPTLRSYGLFEFQVFYNMIKQSIWFFFLAKVSKTEACVLTNLVTLEQSAMAPTQLSSYSGRPRRLFLKQPLLSHKCLCICVCTEWLRDSQNIDKS